MFMAKPDFRWGLLLFKLILLAGIVHYFARAAFLFIVVLLIVVWLACKCLTFIFPQALVTGVASQIIGFVLTRRLIGGSASVPVRDVRVLDASGQQFLVRLKGHLKSGNLAVGDEVIAKGWMRRGTLLFRRGFNKRINAAIRVKAE